MTRVEDGEGDYGKGDKRNVMLVYLQTSRNALIIRCIHSFIQKINLSWYLDIGTIKVNKILDAFIGYKAPSI